MSVKLPDNRLLISMTGPSGVGKDTLMQELSIQDGKINFFTTATTRPPRGGEVDGEHYYFLTNEAFEEKVQAGEFLEYNGNYLGRRYGTLKAEIAKHMDAGCDVISDINYTGVQQFKEKVPCNLLSILILPPSLGELINRMQERRKLTLEDPTQLAKRLERITLDLQHIDEPNYVFQSADLIGSQKSDYDYVIVNNNLDDAVRELLDVINAERSKRQEQKK
jgi:guanylate kinase